VVSVYVVAASDAERDEERRLRWGDYWFKDSLGAAIGNLGHTITDNVAEADVIVNCRGAGVEGLPEWTFNILWIIGHPDTVTVNECLLYDAVCCESERFAEHLRGWGIACHHLPGASDMVPMPDVVKQHGAVFVGNWRPGRELDSRGLPLAVWGEGWDGKLPEGAWRGPYYPHEGLNELYASAELLLNDHHEDMARWGFHNPRHYDIAAVAGKKVPTFAECAAAIMALVPEKRHMLDLGCGATLRRGFIGIDKAAEETGEPWYDTVTGKTGVVRHDLENGLPPIWDVGVIVADNVLEHINNLIRLLNDCHKALLPTGGRIHITVPNAARSIAAAWSDPTHVRAFTPETFDYLNVDHPRWQQYGQSYGFLPWRVLRLVERDRFVDGTMRPAT